MKEVEVGTVMHFFDKAGVAAITMSGGKLAVGDTLHIKGHTTDVTVTVESMQVDHKPVDKASKGDDVGVKIDEKVREHDTVFKVVED